MARNIAVVSGKGGVGKTTIVAQLGRFLTSLKKRVLVIDCDFGLNNLDVTLGAENLIKYDLSDVLSGRCRLKQALIFDPVCMDLAILPSDKMQIDSYFNQRIKALLTTLNIKFDYVLIDAPAGLDTGFLRAISLADEAIVVTTPYPTGLRDADKAISALQQNKIDKIHLLVNKVRGDLILSNKCVNLTEIESLLKRKIIGVIPDDDVLLTSVDGRIKRNSYAYKAFLLTAKNLEQKTTAVFDPTTRYQGIFGGVKRYVRGNL